MNRIQKLLMAQVILLLAGVSYAVDSDPTEYIVDNSTGIKERIKRVENGLLPALQTKGSEFIRYTIPERMAHYPIPGVSLAVINDGKIEWAKAYGVKDVETQAAVTLNTMFQAASISKPITAAAILNLVETNNLDLESSINSHLASWKLPNNELTQKQPVTLKMLLTHTAGTTGAGFDGYAGEDNLPTLLQILDGVEPAHSEPVRVDILPGSQWRYSGGGYLILQQLAMDITQSSFTDLMHHTILQPLGMDHSTFSQPLPSSCESEAATGYRADGSKVAGKWRVYPEMAAGGLWTTPMDLCHFIIEIQQSLKGQSNQLLSQPMTQNMLSRHFGDMALGLVLRGQGHELSFTFNGGNAGYRCELYAYTVQGKGAVIMTNSDEGSSIIGELYRSISAEYGWPHHKPEVKEST